MKSFEFQTVALTRVGPARSWRQGLAASALVGLVGVLGAMSSADAAPVAACVNATTNGTSVTALAAAPVAFCVSPYGTPQMWVQQQSSSVQQYYGTFPGDAWNSIVWLNGADASQRYGTGSTSSGLNDGRPNLLNTPFVTPVSNTVTGAGTVADPYVITTVVDLGTTTEQPGVRMTQRITYVNGDRNVRHNWSLANTGSSTFNDLRFFHGGDTYFGGLDSGRSWYDPVSAMVYITNTSTSTTGYMGFYANPATPSSAYFAGRYATGNSQASAGQLSNTADPSQQDNGYYLQWNRATLNPGETWNIEATEVWSLPGNLQTFVPVDAFVLPSTTRTQTFSVQNLDSDTLHPAMAVDLSVAVMPLPAGWSASLVGPSTLTLAPGERQDVVVEVTIPAGAAPSDFRNIQLTAVASAATPVLTSTSSNRLTILDSSFSLNSNSLNFGTQLIGSGHTQTITLTNNAGGSPVNLGQISGGDSSFTIESDTCSGQTVAAGGSCSVVVKFSPAAVGSFSSDVTFPILSPVVVTQAVTVSGVGVAAGPNPGPGNARPIPTVSQWGLLLLASLVGGSGLLMRRRVR